MGDNDLISFITKSRAKKRTDGQIRASLQSVGWKPEKIDAAFRQVDSSGLSAEQKSDGLDYMPQNVQAAQKKEDARAEAARQSAQDAQQAAAKQQSSQSQLQAAQAAKSTAPQSPAPAKQPQPAIVPPAFPFQKQQPAPASAQTQQASAFPAKQQPSAFPAQPQPASAQQGAFSATQSAPAQQSGIFKPAQAAAQQAAQSLSQQAVNPTLASLGAGGKLPIGKNNLPMILAALVIIALAAAAFIYLGPKGEAPAVPAPSGQANNSSILPEANNSSQPPLNPTPKPTPLPPEQPPAGGEGQPILPSLPEAPATPPNNGAASPPAATPEPIPAEQPPVPAPEPAPTPAPEPPPAAPPAANASNASNTSANGTDLSVGYAQVFQRSSTRGTPASGFCIEYDLGHFIQLHYKMYYGSSCTSEKPNTGGYAWLDEFKADKCEFVPCCVNGPLGEYSKGYDTIYCGY